MPIARLGGVRITLSYSVFFVAAILVAIVVQQSANNDLVHAVWMGIGFWLSGWLVQAVVQVGLSWALAVRLTHLSFGLVGVEALPRIWPASKSFLVGVASIVALLALGSFYRLVEGGFQLPTLAESPESIWVAPGIGLTANDSIWRAAAWLCWAQAVFQMYPLPRTIGRQIFAALTGICARHLELSTQVVILRRCLCSLSIMTVAFSIPLMLQPPQSSVLIWPYLLLMAVLLWVSSQSHEMVEMLNGYRMAMPSGQQSGAAERVQERATVGVVEAVRNGARNWRNRRRAQRALRQERDEASDAQRLDEILVRLHRHGIESLDPEDRKLLDRVSESLRGQRQSDSEQQERNG